MTGMVLGVSSRILLSLFHNRPTSEGGKGWLLGARDPSDVYNCPGRYKDENNKKLILFRCNKNGHYPNFYAIQDENSEREYVFFDVDGKNFRLYVSKKERIVRYEECKK